MMDQFKCCQVCITLELKNNKRFVHTVWFLTLRWRSQEIQFSFLEPQESLIWIGCTVHCMANNVLENPELFGFRQAPLKNHYRNEWHYESGRKTSKVGSVFLMVIVSLLPVAEIGRNDHRENALHLYLQRTMMRKLTGSYEGVHGNWNLLFASPDLHFRFWNEVLYFFQFIELEGAPVIINIAEIIRNFG